MSQSFLLEYSEGSSYTRKMVFDVFGQDRLEKFNIKVGQTVCVSLNIEAQEKDGRWFNSVRAWDVRQRDEQTRPEANASGTGDEPKTAEQSAVNPADPFGAGATEQPCPFG